MKKRFLAGIALTAVAGILQAGDIKYEKSGSKILIDQGSYTCTVDALGGQITSWKLKNGERELVANPSLHIGGAGKVKDGLFNDISPQSAEYGLNVEKSGDGKLTVVASWKGTKGVFKGIKLERRFMFDKDYEGIAVRETLQAMEKGGDIFLQFHNSLALDGIDGKQTVFSSCKDGKPVRFSYSNLRTAVTQAVVEPEVPWFGYVNGEKKNGFALLFEKASTIRNMFAWCNGKLFTMSANFQSVNIAPVAERDVWYTTYYMLPLQGDGELLSVTTDIVVSGKKAGNKTNLYVWLPEIPAAKEVYAAVGGKTLAAVPVKAGCRLYTLNFAETAGKVTVGFRGGKVAASVEIDGKFAAEKALAPVRRIPKVSYTMGPQGFYYYYPDFYVAQNAPAWFGIALQGNFKNKKNFRSALILPEEVEYMYLPENAVKSNVVIDGKKMICYEIPNKTNTSKSQVLAFCLKLKKALPEGSKAYLQTRWDGGSLKMLKYNVKEVSGFPQLKGQLKHLTMGIQARRDPARQPLEIYGMNRLMYIRQESDFYYEHRGVGHHQAMLDKLEKERNIEGIMAYLSFYRLSRFFRAKNSKPLLKEIGTLFTPKREYKPLENPDKLWAVDMTGKKTGLLCLYNCTRTRYMDKTLDQHKVAMDYGWNNFAIDEEHWSNGATLCCCEDCNKEFARRAKAAGLEVVDLITLANNPEKYPRQSELWWDMKTDLVAEIYKMMRENLDTYKPNGKQRKLLIWVDRRVSNDGTRYSAISNRLSDYRKLAVYADELLPMCYEASSAFVGRCAYETSTLIKGLRAKLIMGIAPHRAYEFNRVVTQDFGSLEALEEQIIECYFNGAKGVMIWAGERCLRGAMDMLNCANAAKRMLPIEEIVCFGKPVKLACDNPAVNVSAIEYKGKIAVFMRNYSSKSMEAELTLPASVKSITDTFTGKKLDKAKVKFAGSKRIHTLLLQ